MATQEELQRRGQGPSPQMGAIALANQRRVERTGGEGLYASADVGQMARQAFPNAMDQLQGAGDRAQRAAGQGNYAGAVGNVIGGAARTLGGVGMDMYDSAARYVLDPAASALKSFVTGDTAPERAPRFSDNLTPTQRGASPATRAGVAQTSPQQPPTRQNYTVQPDPMQGPASGMSVRNTSVDGVRRIDNAPGLNSPLFTNLPTGEAVSGMQGGTVSTISGPARRPGAIGAVQSPQAPSGPRGGVIGDGRDPSAERYSALMRDVARLSQGGRAGRNQAAALVSAFQAAQRGEADERSFAQGQEELAFRQEDAAAGRAQTSALEQMRQQGALGLEEMRQRSGQPLQDAQIRQLDRQGQIQGQALPREDGQVLRALQEIDPEQAKEYYADVRNQRQAYGLAAQALAAAQQDGLTEQQIMADPRLREAYITVYGAPRMANGGLVPDYDSAMGYAQGGMVRGAGYGQTPQAAAVLPEINEYRDYAMGAKSLGLPAVPFEQFLTLRQGAKQVAAAPQGAMAFANGGQVPDPRDVSGRMVMDTDPNAPTDSIPAMVDESMPAKLDSGEFVIPKDVVQFFGTDKLNKMIAQARQGQ